MKQMRKYQNFLIFEDTDEEGSTKYAMVDENDISGVSSARREEGDIAVVMLKSGTSVAFPHWTVAEIIAFITAGAINPKIEK